MRQPFKPLLHYCCVLSALSMASAAPRSALVVGISTYPKDGSLATLPNPANDAKLVAGALEKAGFKVVLATDVTKGQLKARLDEFVGQIDPGGAAVVYFAGHGVQWEGKNFLMAGNAKLQHRYDLGEESLEADTVLAALADKRPKTALVFLDCCRVPPSTSWLMSAKERSQTRSGLAAMEHADLLISYAAAPGKPAYDGKDGNSPYAVALARNILTGQELTKMLKSVTTEVLAATGDQQRPYQTGSLLEDFYFAPGVSLPNPIPAPMPPKPPAADPAQRLAAATKDAPFENSLGMKFVPVPIAGGPTDGQKVYFCIHETRVKDFRAFVTADKTYDYSKGMVPFTWTGTEFKPVPGKGWDSPGFNQDETHPVTCVSWEDAQAFIAWLNKQEPGLTYRLPTDHEWSCAVGIGDRENAAASPESKHAKIEGVYPWGTSFPPPSGSGNYADSAAAAKFEKRIEGISGYTDGYAGTAPVMSFPKGRSNDGLYDLGGNVWEWMASGYDGNDPLGKDRTLTKGRALRGGSWDLNGPGGLLSSSRGFYDPGSRGIISGIRLLVVVGAGAGG
ncbi:MAG: SUMF1/EgtB/PvdO family nonheme iron enzyme [Verrucomicrobiales bacterium]|nr:SUMF1/EgtB/PvdO family nonheme iron enzyme [Verrucomicrobiales bacterium]